MFRYPLQAVLKQGEWRVDAQRIELAAASRQLEAAEAAVDLVRQGIVAAETEMRQQADDLNPIDVDRRCLLTGVLRTERLVLAGKGHELEETRQRYQQALDALHEAQRALRLLEQHRERLATEWRKAEIVREERASDELWLLSGQTK